MLWTSTNQKEKIASLCRLGLAIVALWLILGLGMAFACAVRSQGEAIPSRYVVFHELWHGKGQ